MRQRFMALSPPRRGLAAAVAFGCVAAAAGRAGAQPTPVSISVGLIQSAKRCTTYQESAGSSSVKASAYGFSAAQTWRTWLVKDCVDNFATFRSSLQAALASSGKFAVRPSGGSYIVTASISDAHGDDAPPAAAPSPGQGGYAASASHMWVDLDLKVSDGAGRLLYGTLLTKRIESSFDVRAGGFRATGAESGQDLYSKLQRETALAVARQVAFHIAPLRVTAVPGPSIQLNYGAPLLAVGSMVQVSSADGSDTARYTVTSTTPTTALADPEGDVRTARIGPGSAAVVIEPEDPAANSRRFKRVELP